MTPLVVRGILGALVLLTAGVLVWVFRRRRNRRAPVERLGLPSLAGGPFALPAGPPCAADAAAEPVDDAAARPRGTATWARWPFAPATTTGERERAEELARLMAEALHEIGPRPPLSQTDHLAEQMAWIIVAEHSDHDDLGLNAGVALTACISDELSHKLRQLVYPSS